MKYIRVQMQGESFSNERENRKNKTTYVETRLVELKMLFYFFNRNSWTLTEEKTLREFTFNTLFWVRENEFIYVSWELDVTSTYLQTAARNRVRPGVIYRFKTADVGVIYLE